jgi:predicted DCC family thiol-disulfide oxidoreductase YuxK
MDKIVLFDDICNFCNGFAQFLTRRDPRKKFNYVFLQSDVGRKYLQNFHLSQNELFSILFIDQKKCYIKSSAILRIIKELHGLYPLLYVFILVPPVIRDFLYDVIAKNRYRWFGKKKICSGPAKNIKSRFL